MSLPGFALLAGVLVAGLALTGCDPDAPRPDGSADAASADPGSAPGQALDRIAEAYVKLVLAVGQHDAGYVDAYYGPAAWREAAQAEPQPLDAIGPRAAALLADLESLDLAGVEEMTRLRRQYLLKQLQALAARVEMLQGTTFTFDEESRALYDAVAPTHSAEHFQRILDRLDARLPGDGPLVERFTRFKQDFIIPPEKLDTVFSAAIAEARRRTKAHLDLPEDERFVVEYVTDKPWSGYNWYQGDAHSLIQVNTDLPIYIDRAVDLAAHEGYPGHHVYNALLEQHLVKDRGWVEFSVYPLFSPQSLIAEGSANFGIDVAFPADERLDFERRVLFPLAGLDASRVDEYYAVEELVGEVSYAGNEAARQYLNGEIDAHDAALWLTLYAMMSKERAEQRVRFIDTYRSYVINYNYGQDLVKTYVERQGGTDDDPTHRWEVFGDLLASPRLPSDLQAETP